MSGVLGVGVPMLGRVCRWIDNHQIETVGEGNPVPRVCAALCLGRYHGAAADTVELRTGTERAVAPSFRLVDAGEQAREAF